MPARGDIVVPGFLNTMTAKDIRLLELLASGRNNFEMTRELLCSLSNVSHNLNVRLYTNLSPVDFEIDPRTYCTRLYWQWKLGGNGVS